MKRFILPVTLIACGILARLAYGANAMANDYCDMCEEYKGELNNLIGMIESGKHIIILHLSADDVPDESLTLEGYCHERGIQGV